MHSQKGLAAAAVAAAAFAKNFLSTTFGGGRGVPTVSNKTRSQFREITLQMQSGGKELFATMVLPEL